MNRRGGIFARTFLPSATYDHLFECRRSPNTGRWLCVMRPLAGYDPDYFEEVPPPETQTPDEQEAAMPHGTKTLELWDMQMFLTNGAKIFLDGKPWHEIRDQIELMMRGTIESPIRSFRIRRHGERKGEQNE